MMVLMISTESAPVGGFLVAERRAGPLCYYEGGKEAEFFSCAEELVEKPKHYLERDEAREAVARAGHARSLSSGYTHQGRVQAIVERIA